MEMEMVMEMVVVMIVRGGLLLCLQHSIPGTYNLNIKIIQKLNTKVILPSNAVFYLLKKMLSTLVIISLRNCDLVANIISHQNKYFNHIKEIFLVLILKIFQRIALAMITIK